MKSTHTAFDGTWSLDDLITAGVYKYISAPKNPPSWLTVAYGTVMVFVAQNYAVQIVCVGSGTAVYLRFRNTSSTTWYDKKLG